MFCKTGGTEQKKHGAEKKQCNFICHGIISQFYGAMGILGICALAKHLFDLGKTVLRRFSAEKLLLAAVPGMILMMSLVDNFFFYANYQFVYCLFLALLEKSDHKRLAQ